MSHLSQLLIHKQTQDQQEAQLSQTVHAMLCSVECVAQLH